MRNPASGSELGKLEGLQQWRNVTFRDRMESRTGRGRETSVGGSGIFQLWRRSMSAIHVSRIALMVWIEHLGQTQFPSTGIQNLIGSMLSLV